MRIENIPPQDGCVYVDVIDGRTGKSLSIGDHQTGTRVAGPKPWGGGSIHYRFQVDASELRAALDEYASKGASHE